MATVSSGAYLSDSGLQYGYVDINYNTYDYADRIDYSLEIVFRSTGAIVDSSISWSISVNGTGVHSGTGSVNRPSAGGSNSMGTYWGTVWKAYNGDQTLSFAGYISGVAAIDTMNPGSVSGSFNVPRIPYSIPRPPPSASATYISDNQISISWTTSYDSASGAQPWTGVYVDRSVDGGAYVFMTTRGWATTSWADTSTSADHSYQYRVCSYNSAGSSTHAYTSAVTTTPIAPGTPTATISGSNINLSFSNTSAIDTGVEVWHAVNNVWDSSALATLAASATTYTHVNYSTLVSHTYRVRTVAGTRVSAFSNNSNTIAPSGARLNRGTEGPIDYRYGNVPVQKIYLGGTEVWRKFLPTDIAGIDLWLKADAITGLSNGAAVASWVDSSGAGNTATNSTTVEQPSYQTNQINGKPAVRFDGTADYLRTNVNMSGADQTVFVVYKKTSTAWAAFMGSTAYGGFKFVSGSTLSTDKNFAAALQTAQTGMPINTWAIAWGQYSDSRNSSRVGFNGWAVEKALTSETLTAGKTGIIGATQNTVSTGVEFYPGDIAEVIHYSSYLTGADTRAVEQYLSDKYNIPLYSRALNTFSSMDLWLKAETLALSDGAAVSSWADSSGAGNTATQGTAGYRPTFQTNELNGYPAVRFDGTDDYMVSNAPTGGGEQTFFVVAKVNLPSTGTAPEVLVGGNQPGGFRLAFSLRRFRTQHYYTGDMRTSEVGIKNNQFMIFHGSYSDSANISSASINGSPAQVVTYNNSLTAGCTTVVAANTAGGIVYDHITMDLAELIHYSAKLTDTEALFITKQLATKYNISLYDGEPANYTGMDLWLTADSQQYRPGFTDGIALTDSWLDMSPGGYTASSFSGREVTLHYNRINQLPSVYFNSANEAHLLSNRPNSGPEQTFFLVIKPTIRIHHYSGGTLLGSRNVRGGFQVKINADATLEVVKNDMELIGVTDANTVPDKEWIIVSGHFSDSLNTYTIRINGTQLEAGSTTATLVAGSALFIGKYNEDWTSLNYEGEMAEIILYSAYRTEEEMAAIERYLSKKYAIDLRYP